MTSRDNFIIDTQFGVIHEDEDILVINKPAPLAVHPVGCYAELNLHSLLKKDSRWADTKLHFTHRLDAETSGVILVAKHYEAARFIGKEFLAGRVHKKYNALVFGVPDQKERRIELPLGHDSSSGFQTVRIIDHENGETARTDYKVLWSNDRYAYLEVQPLTGRTHQIRAHLSFIGHPIVGDKIYIDIEIFSRYVIQGLDEAMLGRIKLPRLALHACSLSFNHPGQKAEVTYTSTPPDFYSQVRA